MDSQDSRALGINYQHENTFNTFKILYSKTDTDVVFSYDADWGNTASHDPYVYDYFSETIRDRETSNLEFRILSNSSLDRRFIWILGFFGTLRSFLFSPIILTLAKVPEILHSNWVVEGEKLELWSSKKKLQQGFDETVKWCRSQNIIKSFD